MNKSNLLLQFIQNYQLEEEDAEILLKQFNKQNPENQIDCLATIGNLLKQIGCEKKIKTKSNKIWTLNNTSSFSLNSLNNNKFYFTYHYNNLQSLNIRNCISKGIPVVVKGIPSRNIAIEKIDSLLGQRTRFKVY